MIRTGEPSDLALCAGMMSSTEPWSKFGYTHEQCLAKISKPRARLLVCQDEISITGFATFRAEGFGSSHLLELLCVSKEHRRQKIGESLLRDVEERVFAIDHNLLLFVSDFNESAQLFYKQMGYIQIGSMPGYNFSSQTELIFRKTTGPRLE